MRNELASYSGHRIGVVATIGFEITSKSYNVVLNNVVLAEDGTLLTDHVWVNIGNELRKNKIRDKETIYFVAKVQPYRKGYEGKLSKKPNATIGAQIDYNLSEPQNLISKSKATKILKEQRHLEKLHYRRGYIEKQQRADFSSRKTVEAQLEINKGRVEKFEGNSILAVTALHTLEAHPGNPFWKRPRVYAVIETCKNIREIMRPVNHPKDVVHNAKSLYGYYYHDADEYHQSLDEIDEINESIMSSRQEWHKLYRRYKNMNKLLDEIDDATDLLEIRLKGQPTLPKNIHWEPSTDFEKTSVSSTHHTPIAKKIN